MKLLRQNLRAPRPDDSLGRGMDAALTVALFFGIGFGLDAWLGTRPIMMIVFTLFAALGTFLSLKYRYDARMAELEAERAAEANRGRLR